MPTFHIKNRLSNGVNGASALDRIGEESYRLDAENQRAAHQTQMEQLERQREERIERMELAHQKTVDAIEERKTKAAEAAASRRQVYEDRMAKAIPELYKIRTDDPKAEDKRADIASRYPDLFHDEKGLPSIKQEFENHGRLVQQFQLQSSKTKADSDKRAAEEKAQADLLAKPPAGTHLKSVRQHGAEFEANATPGALPPAETSRLKKEFRTARANYEGAIAGLADPEATTAPTATQLIQKQRNKELMQEAADQIIAANPAAAQQIKDQIQKSILHDHAIVESKLPGISDDKKQPWIDHINELKDELGFQRIDKTGKVIASDSSPAPVAPSTPVNTTTKTNSPELDNDEPTGLGPLPENPNIPASNAAPTAAAPTGSAPVGTVTDATPPSDTGAAADATPETMGTPESPHVVKTADDFHALPSGAHFIDPDGKHRIKP